MLQRFFYELVALIVVVDPIGTAVLFLGLTPHATGAHRRVMALRGVLIATGIFALFALAGEILLDALGISIPAFRIGGGLLLFLLAADMVFALHSGIKGTTGAEQQEASHSHDVSVFPLAIPLLAGPGALTSIMLLSSRDPSLAGHASVLTALVAVMVLALAALYAAAVVARILGVTGANVVTRVLGVVLAALAAQYVIDGIRESFGLG